MKFWRYNLKNILSVCCMGLVLSVGTTGIWCPGWAGRDEEGLREIEEKYKKQGYVFVDEFSDQPQSSQPQVTQPSQPTTPQTTVNPVKTCKHAYDVKITREATCDGTGEMVYTCRTVRIHTRKLLQKQIIMYMKKL